MADDRRASEGGRSDPRIIFEWLGFEPALDAGSSGSVAACWRNWHRSHHDRTAEHGADCLQASKFLEQALGAVAGERKTAEFFQANAAEQHLNQ